MKGRFSQNLPSHAMAYHENPRITITTAVDTNEEKLIAFQNKWGTRTLYTDYKLMLKCEKIDMVSICTPAHTHYDILKDSAKRSIKAIWCEKPLCDDINKAKEMVSICKNKKIVLAVNYFRRWSIPYQKLRKFIQNGRLGRVQRIICYYSKGVLNNGSHLIDILRFFFGEIEWVEGAHFLKEGTKKDDLSLDATLWFKMGFPATLHAFNDAHFRIIEIDMFGTKGRVCIKDSVNKFEFFEAGKHPIVAGLKVLSKVTAKCLNNNFMQPMSSELKNLINCIDGKDEKLLCSGEDALRTLLVAQAIRESFMRKGRRLKIESD